MIATKTEPFPSFSEPMHRQGICTQQKNWQARGDGHVTHAVMSMFKVFRVLRMF